MTHSYYSDDSEWRKKYFEDNFFSLAQDFASKNNMSVTQLLSNITGLNSFKNILKAVFSMDTSLSAYVDGMKDKDFRTFFERNKIQNLVENNQKEKPIIQQEIPKFIQQVDKKERQYVGKQGYIATPTSLILPPEVEDPFKSKDSFIKALTLWREEDFALLYEFYWAFSDKRIEIINKTRPLKRNHKTSREVFN